MTIPQDVKLARHAGDLDDDGHDMLGTTWKSPCRAATTANITIATALNNGDSLDGVTLATGDRVLVKNQSTGSQNGIYVVGASPARATDYDSSVDIVGSVVIVTEGTTNADTAWLCTTNATITVGTTALVFAAFGTGGSGIARIVAAAAIANTETVVAAYSMPAGFMAVGTTFRIKAYGRLTTGATAGSSIFRCRIGTTTLTGNIPATLTIANAALVTNAPFVLDMLVTVRTAGASGTAIGNVSVNGGVTGAFTVVDDISVISATVVVDTTATKRIELTYISGNAGTTATFENAVIEIANT